MKDMKDLIKRMTHVYLLFVLLVAPCLSQTRDRTAPDVILINGKIVTVDPNFTVASAVAIRDGKMLAVGSTDEIEKMAGASTERIDLGGKTVIPGLIDNHTHATLGAFCEGPEAPELNILQLDSDKAVIEAVKKRVQQAKPDEWIITTCMWPGTMREGKLPTRDDLDPFSPNNPVFLRRGGGEYILNTAALKLLDIDQNTPAPEMEGTSGAIHKDANGRLTGDISGVGWDEMMRRVFALQGGDIDEYWIMRSYPMQERRKRFKYVMALYNQCGLTSIRDMSVSRRDFIAYQQLWANHELTVRVNAIWAPLGNLLSKEELLRQIREQAGPKSGFGDEWLRVGGIKIHNWGTDKVRAAILEANRWGWTLAIHHLGGLLVTQIVDILEEANKEVPIAGRRFSLEHDFGALDVLGRDENFNARLKRLGLTIAPQPQWGYYGPRDVPLDVKELEKEDYMPLRDWMKAGLNVTGGSDHPGLPYDPDHPLLGLYWSITRKQISGAILNGSQKLTREEALKLYTINGAYATFEEKIKGSIEPGKVADLVVLSDDYLHVPEEKILDIKVLMTMVGGKIVYQAPH
jgi:hypothetical protein